MNFRLRYWLAGGHVHVRVFSGKARNMTHGKNGDLVFTFEEWPIFLSCLHCGQGHVEVVHENELLP